MNLPRHFARTARAYRQSADNLWIAACCAAQIVGEYEDYVTRRLADELGCEKSAVENWAHAWFLYSDIRRHDIQTAHTLREIFTVSHFYTAWELKNKYGYSIQKVVSYFASLLEMREEGVSWSVVTLRKLMDNKSTDASWDWYQPRLQSMWASLVSLPDIPQTVRTWLTNAPQEARKE